jgi:hypothetical protein
MKFTAKMTVEEKKAIYTRSLGHLEKDLIGMLTQEGIDPDAFDEDAYDPQPMFDRDTLDPQQLRIIEVIGKIKKIKTAIDTLS